MTPHSEQEVCLKEKEWREVHEFISGTVEYRKGLNREIAGVKNGMWAVVLVVLIPFITGMIWIGEIKGEVRRHGSDISELKDDVKELKNVSYGWKDAHKVVAHGEHDRI